MIAALRQFYGLQPTPPADLFQFLVWEILSEHALPARRDLAWQALRRIPALTPDAVFRTPQKDLLEVVGTAGPHRDEKVERIRAVVGEFRRHRERLHAEALAGAPLITVGRVLRRLDSVPPAMRDRAILFAVGRPVLPIDDEVHRVVSRLRGEPHNRRRSRTRRWLKQHVPSDISAYREAIVYLRHHALHTCVKVGPHCTVCPLRLECGSVQGGDAAP